MSSGPSNSGKAESSSGRNYKPTSLDFINRPNPVEPNANSHGSSSGRRQQLERNTNEDFLRVLLGSRLAQSARDSAPDAARATRQAASQPSSASLAAVLNDVDDITIGNPSSSRAREANEQAIFTLPELPVKRGIKRPRTRVPPVLQGLHQPPPDAGILPSMSTEDGQSKLKAIPSRSFDHIRPSSPIAVSEASISATSTVEPAPRPCKRNKWSEEETAMLLIGVTRFGIGSWKKILLCPDYQFETRTASDLKDRFRVCYPAKKARQDNSKILKLADALPPNDTIEANPPNVVQDVLKGPAAPPVSAASVTNDAPTVSSMPFPESKRRRRTRYTPEEDAAILSGFQKYGASWSLFQIDPALKHRTPTDLRDRFRTKFADEYGKAGLTPKPARTSKAADRSTSANTPSNMMSTSDGISKTDTVQGNRTLTEKSRTSHPAPFPTLEEDWLADLHLPTDEDDADADPIVLDRSIMDWANRTLPSLSSNRPLSDVDPGGPHGIDPLTTIRVPPRPD